MNKFVKNINLDTGKLLDITCSEFHSLGNDLDDISLFIDTYGTSHAFGSVGDYSTLVDVADVVTERTERLLKFAYDNKDLFPESKINIEYIDGEFSMDFKTSVYLNLMVDNYKVYLENKKIFNVLRFKNEGLPYDLVELPMLESSYGRSAWVSPWTWGIASGNYVYSIGELHVEMLERVIQILALGSFEGNRTYLADEFNIDRSLLDFNSIHTICLELSLLVKLQKLRPMTEV